MIYTSPFHTEETQWTQCKAFYFLTNWALNPHCSSVFHTAAFGDLGLGYGPLSGVVSMWGWMASVPDRIFTKV